MPLKTEQSVITITVDTPGTGLLRTYTLIGDVYVFNGWAANPEQSITFPDGTSINGNQPGAYTTIKDCVANVQDGWTVHLADGNYTGSDNRNITIDKDITLSGQSQNGTVIDAEESGRIFTITGNSNVTMQKLTLANGKADDGGAIFEGSALTVNDSVFTANRAVRNGNTGGNGGAINNSGELTVTGTTFKGNSAYHGGAIYLDRNTFM